MAVQKMMVESLQKLMKQAVLDYDDQDRKDFVLTHKGQIVATTAQVTNSLKPVDCYLGALVPPRPLRRRAVSPPHPSVLSALSLVFA